MDSIAAEANEAGLTRVAIRTDAPICHASSGTRCAQMQSMNSMKKLTDSRGVRARTGARTTPLLSGGLNPTNRGSRSHGTGSTPLPSHHRLGFARTTEKNTRRHRQPQAAQHSGFCSDPPWDIPDRLTPALVRYVQQWDRLAVRKAALVLALQVSPHSNGFTCSQ